ncbi:MAG: aminotransferase class III-fold pyridoxal phosphate-dependent enzyme, partial [Terriglobales bacterium]
TSSKQTQRARFAPLMPGVFHISYPDPYRPPHGCGDAGAASLDELERLFHTTTPPDEVAAIVFEPVQGEGGYVVPPAGFVRRLREVCDQHGILLIADEVQSGAGRTGRMWAMEHFGVAPDIVCSAKGIASGMPLGVTFSRAGIMDWTPGAHASTFGGNPVVLAAAEATLGLLRRELTENARDVGQYLLEQLQSWPAEMPEVGEVRGLGLMIGIEMVRDQRSKTPDPALRDRIVQRAFEHGLLILGCGTSTVRLMPPLICTRAHADMACEILRQSVREARSR